MNKGGETKSDQSKGKCVTTPKNKGIAKHVVKVDSIYTAPKWPTIEASQQDIILELLCNLLEPIGQHRSNHVVPSKGKRSKKRKRRETMEGKDTTEQITPPTSPEIAKYIIVGFNSTVRHLQDTINLESSQTNELTKPATNHLLTIFLTQATTHLPYTPLPLLTHIYTRSYPSQPPTHLVPLSLSSEAKLCKALGIPRVGILGIFEGAPGANSLLEHVTENVDVVDVPWAREAVDGKWLGTKILFGEDAKEEVE